MLLIGIVILIIVGAAILFLNSASFGSLPSAADLKKIHSLSYFRSGQFQNLSPTPSLTEGTKFFSVLKEFLFDKSSQNKPPAPLPSIKTNLLRLERNKNLLVWFGHSSYYMQIDGKRILVDPVFSGNASPLRYTTKSFAGSDIYDVSDLPDIDYLFITHDHWDHLDYPTILKLKSKVTKIITGPGVGAHLIFWGFDKESITEMTWDSQANIEAGFSVDAVTARHFSGRGIQRNKSQWSSFVLTTMNKKIFIGGDSGYGSHFAEIGKRFGTFDLAILEDGQYNINWKYIHMMPEETVQAAIDLGAKKLLPVHWAKFSLSLHAWDEPIIRIKKEADLKNVCLLHPMIGEYVDLDASQIFTCWWERIQ
ncbi:MAG TPA: MBL fold metallo-hydrolase [Puia sp.]|nr:MBL fold metallo-hydrolase [Puia sp.]